jgi:hypothetical protein
MVRSYIVTFSFVDATLAWACWAVPLLVAEPLIQLRGARRARSGR